MRMLRFAFAAIAAVLTFSAVSEAKDVQVQGYVRKDGTYVAPYMRTAPDSNPYNNFSTRGNINPYTGEEGTKNPETSRGYVSPYSAPSGLYEPPKPPPEPSYNFGNPSYIDPAPLPPGSRSSSYGR